MGGGKFFENLINGGGPNTVRKKRDPGSRGTFFAIAK